MAKPIPEGYHSVTPYLIIKGATEAIDFYKKAFGATELFRMPAPGGKIGHAEIKIGDSPIMLADESPEMGYKSPQSLGGSPISIMIYVTDVDTVSSKPLRLVARNNGRSRTSSMVTGAALSKIRSGMSGMSRRTRKMCRPRKWSDA